MQDSNSDLKSDLVGVRMVAVTGAEQGQRIDNFLLSRAPGVPRSHVYRIIRKGQVRVNGGRIKPTRKLQTGDVVRIPPMQLKAASSVTVPDDLVRSVRHSLIHECDDYLVMNKPAGLAVHGGSGLAFGAIDALRQALAEPELELVHRLDRGTSGCLLVARNRGIGRNMQTLFRERKIRKSYLALLDGVWEHGDRTVTAPLAKNKAHAGERRVMVSSDGQSAISHFSAIETYAQGSLMRVEIETGRTHQIRVHARYCGHPVIGDKRYGDNKRNANFKRLGLNRLYLHSESLAFEWNGERVELLAPAGDLWEQAMADLDANKRSKNV